MFSRNNLAKLGGWVKISSISSLSKISSNKVALASGVIAGGLLSAYYAFSMTASASTCFTLDPDQFKRFKLDSVKTLNHNTKVFRFNLDSPYLELAMPIASCVSVKLDGVVNEKGEPVSRPYTPIYTDDTGHLNLLVKRYEGGALTPFIHKMQPGDEIQVKGPFSKIPYSANMKKRIGMISGGTGITPMLQIIDAILKDPNDKTQVDLVFCNIAYQDILLKSELDALSSKHKNFNVHYVLQVPEPTFDCSLGYLNSDIVQKHLPPPSDDHLICVCGPPPMMKSISGAKAPDRSQGELDGLLKQMGYTKDQVYKF